MKEEHKKKKNNKENKYIEELCGTYVSIGFRDYTDANRSAQINKPMRMITERKFC